MHVTDDIIYKLVEHFQLTEFEPFECPLTQTFFNSIYKSGGISYNDGVLLYTLVKSLQPKTVVELGTFIGISGRFIVSALDLNEQTFTTVDESTDEIMTMLHDNPIGFWIKQFADDITMITDNAPDYLATLPDNSIDFLFEDTAHTYELTKAICTQLPRVMKRNGFVAFHDSLMTPMVEAFKELGMYDSMLFMFPYSSLGIWRNI